MLYTFSFFRIHVHDFFFSDLLYHLLLFKCHVVNGVSREALLDCLIVWQHIFLDHRIDLLCAAYLQLLLEVLSHIAHLLFHLINQVSLPLQVHLFVGYELIQEVCQQLTAHVQTGGCIFQGLSVKEGEGIGERKT
jgi:hypothetical protein